MRIFPSPIESVLIVPFELIVFPVTTSIYSPAGSPVNVAPPFIATAAKLSVLESV